MKFIEQCKGIDADKSKVKDSDMFLASKKYDGVYVQIQKENDKVCFFTSSGKEFDCNFREYFLQFDFDFKIECEYFIGDGSLGLRFYADNELKKVVKDDKFLLTGSLAIFDFINFDMCFLDRLESLKRFKNTNSVFVVEFELISYIDAKNRLLECVKIKQEGLFLKRENHKYIEGKKSNDALKLKYKFTADLKVYSIKNGYISLIDSDGRIVNNLPVGMMTNYINVNDIVEIEYEQILETYQVPVFKCIRHDKVS